MRKEESQELTEKLDQEWKSIQALLVKKTPKCDRAEEEKPKVGSRPPPEMLFLHLSAFIHPFLCSLSLCALQLEQYDMMVRELVFDMKAQPSEKLKTPEELAREEREKLQKLEVWLITL